MAQPTLCWPDSPVLSEKNTTFVAPAWALLFVSSAGVAAASSRFSGAQRLPERAQSGMRPPRTTPSCENREAGDSVPEERRRARLPPVHASWYVPAVLAYHANGSAQPMAEFGFLS